MLVADHKGFVVGVTDIEKTGDVDAVVRRQRTQHAPGGVVTDRHDGSLLFTAKLTGAELLQVARLDEAHEHFERLRAWGFTFLRLLVTWEAIEHAGPGTYDTDYLDYLEALVRKAGEHGLSLFIDPHQDVWSRFTGGDGAPGWTLEAVGFDVDGLVPAGAALVHGLHDGDEIAFFPPVTGG